MGQVIQPSIRIFPRLCNLTLTGLMIVTLLIITMLTPILKNQRPVYGISECDKIAVDKGSILTDNEKCTDPCVAPSQDVAATNEPGPVFVLGDSIGEGVTPPLQNLLPESDGWGVNGNSLQGRSLTEGIGIANTNPDGLSTAKHILVILGTNNLTNGDNQAKISEMMSVLKSKNSDASIYWLKINVTRSDIVSAMGPYNDLLASSGAKLIDSTVTIRSDGLHPVDYGELANDVATALKGGSALDTGGTGAPAPEVTTNQNVTLSETSNEPTTEQPERTSNLDLRAKLAMLLYARANTESEIQSAVGKGVGGIFVRPGDANNATVYNSIKTAVGDQKILIGVDFEGGRVQAPGDEITGDLPSARELGQMSDDEIKNIAKEKGAQLSALGINVDFAPVIDIGGTNNDVIGDRAFGNDPLTVTAKAGAFSDGLSESNIISTLKHFPGHGSSEGDSHENPVRTKSLAELEARDIIPFKNMSSREKTIIMMGHLLVPEWGNTATSLNPQAYQYIRSVLNYNGVVVTDALDMKGIPSPATQPERALVAIQSGADMALLNSTSQIDPTIDQLEFAVTNGSLSQERVDEAVSRIILLRDNINATPNNTSEVTCAPCSVGGTVPLDGENPKRLFQFLLGEQLSAEQAAGVTGAIMVESGPNIDPRIRGGGGNNYMGIAQWDIPGRWAALVNWAKTTYPNESEPEFKFEYQVEYMWKEAGERKNGPNNETNVEGIKRQPDLEHTAWYWGRFFEVAITGGSSTTYPENVQSLDKRITYAESVLSQYGNLAGSSSSLPGGGGAACSSPVLSGVDCPANLEQHESKQGYYKMPEAPNGEYNLTSRDAARYGSQQLVCVLYSVGLAFNTAMNGRSKLNIGDLNATGHKSHNKGVAVDLSGAGELQVASHTASWKGRYDSEATIALGKLFVDTGSIKNIWWCQPSGDGSTEAIAAYAEQKGTPINIKCISGHANHFHVDLKDEYRLEFWEP